MKLSQLEVGSTATILSVEAEHSLLLRLQSLNIQSGRTVRVLRIAPFGGGMMLDADGVRVALCRSIAQLIWIRKEGKP